MKKRFDPIKDKSADIIEYIMSSPDIPDDPSIEFKVRLSVEEVVENVVRYAYHDGAGWLEAGTELEAGGLYLSIQIRDAGKPFNPLEEADKPDLQASAEERSIGGLGIFLCKQMMDYIHYAYEDGCNVLTMKKRIN